MIKLKTNFNEKFFFKWMREEAAVHKITEKEFEFKYADYYAIVMNYDTIFFPEEFLQKSCINSFPLYNSHNRSIQLKVLKDLSNSNGKKFLSLSNDLTNNS